MLQLGSRSTQFQRECSRFRQLCVIQAGIEPHALHHLHDRLGRDISRSARGIGAAAKAAYDRQTSLREQRISSEKDFQEAKAAYKKADQQLFFPNAN